jgi:hypothetical protein
MNKSSLLYVYAARNKIQHAGVQYVIDSIIHALDQNPDRRFIYVEIGFFWRWWRQQTDDMRNKVKQFVSEGQIASCDRDCVSTLTRRIQVDWSSSRAVGA